MVNGEDEVQQDRDAGSAPWSEKLVTFSRVN